MNLEDPGSQLIHVVAGAVTDAEGRVLIAQRPPGKQLAGSWEFPGGKLEAGESRADGLARELREELGIEIREPRPLMRLRHSYPFGEVLIDMWVVDRYSGQPSGLDGQELRWCTREELDTVELLAADRPIVRALRLPERLTRVSTSHYWVSDLGKFRQPAAGASAASDTRLQGVACSNAAEAAMAATAGADFLVLTEALAPVELAALCQSVTIPVYARGLPLEEAWTLGASGLNELKK